MLLLRRIENRHVLWTALSMVAMGFIVPGGFGVKPPQWFHDRPPQDIGSVSSAEIDLANTSISVVTPGAASKVEDDLFNVPTAQHAPEPAQKRSRQIDLMIIPSDFARYIPAKHFKLT